MPPPERRFDIDWLRVIAIFLLIPFHTGRIFDDDGFYVKNAVLSPFIEEFIHFFLGQWRLALLFVVSGIGTYFALGLRSGRQYLKERLDKLMLPLGVGILVVVPPQIYYRNLFEGRFEGSYWAFYPTFFQGISPTGNFEWAHLWFLVYLFAFSLLALPLFLYFRSPGGGARLGRLAAFSSRPGMIYLWALPLIIGEVALRPQYDGVQTLVGDWANVVFYLLLFVYGYVLGAHEGLLDALRRGRRTSLGLALGGLAVLYALRWTGNVPESDYTFARSAWAALTTAHAWFWVCTLVRYAHTYLQRGGGLLTALGRVTYPVYIFHQTVIVVVGYYVISWPLGVELKFAIICGAAFLISPLLALLTQLTPFTRLLFGGRAAFRERADKTP